MLRWILFETTTFGAGDNIKRSEKNVIWLLEGLVQRDQTYLRERPNTPRLYRSGVRYMLPQQFAGDVDEVKIIKAALGRASQQPSVRQALETVQEVLGGERFRDIGRIIENGGGDCFPINALVVKNVSGSAKNLVIAEIQRGDLIWGRGRWSLVQAVVAKGVLPVDEVTLDGSLKFRLTRGHKMPVICGDNVRRIVLGQLEPGMRMIRPQAAILSHFTAEYAPYFAEGLEPFNIKSESIVEVTDVRRAVAEMPCLDLQTDDHYVFLNNAGVVVSNCDNLACWRVAELRQGGIKARPFMSNRKRPDGGTTYHALVIWPSLMALVKDGILSESVVRGRPDANYETTEDSSLLLGMGGAGRIPDRNVEIEKNRERCDLLRQAKGIRTDMLSPPGNIDSILDDVLGLRRRNIARQTVLGADAALLELDEIFKSAA